MDTKTSRSWMKDSPIYLKSTADEFNYVEPIEHLSKLKKEKLALLEDYRSGITTAEELQAELMVLNFKSIQCPKQCEGCTFLHKDPEPIPGHESDPEYTCQGTPYVCQVANPNRAKTK